MNILLAGANGFIGRNIAAALVAAGHQVVPVSRRHGIDLSNMTTPTHWLPLLKHIDAVINCVGIIGETGSQRFEPLHTLAPSALFRACSEAGVRRVLQISALGTDKTAFSAYHLSKRAADDVLRNLDLDWFVLRPSLIYGKGGKSAELFMRLARLPLIPVIGDGSQKLQPVHISDVVATVMQCLTSREARKTLDILGTETVTFSEWMQWMRQAQGLPRAPVFQVPFWLAMLLARVARHFNPMLQPENLRMLQTGYWADVQPLVRFLGRKPLAVAHRLFFTDVISTDYSTATLSPPPCRGITSDLAGVVCQPSRMASSYIRAREGVETVRRDNSTPIPAFPLQGGRSLCSSNKRPGINTRSTS